MRGGGGGNEECGSSSDGSNLDVVSVVNRPMLGQGYGDTFGFRRVCDPLDEGRFYLSLRSFDSLHSLRMTILKGGASRQPRLRPAAV
jgi:hypothetical protein